MLGRREGLEETWWSRVVWDRTGDGWEYGTRTDMGEKKGEDRCSRTSDDTSFVLWGKWIGGYTTWCWWWGSCMEWDRNVWYTGEGKMNIGGRGDVGQMVNPGVVVSFPPGWLV